VKSEERRVIAFAWVLLLSAAACATDAGAGAEFTMVDSAGVSVVTNVSGSWTEATAWRLGAQPTLDIGVLEGEPEYQLFRARDALRLPDGRIVVANAGTNEIRFFDSHGIHIRTVGRQGNGPGEFEGLGILRPFPGDSLLAYDYSLARASVLDAHGEFGRSYRVVPPTEGGFAFAVDALSDGTLIVRSPQIFQGALSDGAQRRNEDHYTISASGEFLDSIGTFVGGDQFIETARDGDSFMVMLMQPAFGRTTVLAAHGTRFCVGTSDTYEVRCFLADGELERIVRRDQANRPVTAADLEGYKQQRLADTDDDNARRRVERQFGEMPIPETMPAYDEIEMDVGGNLWVREYAWQSGIERRWTVFDAEGRMLGDVTTPADFRITQIGDDFMLGVWRDDLDVEHVRMYELLKP
jgi:hypothetical protein